MSNIYCESALHQMEVLIDTVLAISSKLNEADLKKRPTSDKHSIGELLEHIAVICEADWLISLEATKEQMDQFYAKVSYTDINSINRNLVKNYQLLKKRYLSLSEEELKMKTTSYWGVTYTRFEWLVQILAHLYHHRGQLHAMLVHCYGQDPQLMMFE